jgi:hypothetical protein
MLDVRSALQVFDKSVLSYPQAKYLGFSTQIAGGCTSCHGFMGALPLWGLAHRFLGVDWGSSGLQ